MNQFEQNYLDLSFTKIDKFIYTLEARIPLLRETDYDHKHAFYLFLKNNVSFNLFFFIDLIIFLEEPTENLNIRKEILKHVAITCLFNKNSIYIYENNVFHGYVRIDDKVYQYEYQTLQDLHSEFPMILNNINCSNLVGEAFE